jgi:phytoene synthase
MLVASNSPRHHDGTSPEPAALLTPGASAAPLDTAQLMARHARTFSFAARFLPAETRRSVFALYAFCRTVDDLVDERGPGWDAVAVRHELDAWRAWLGSDRNGPGPREPLASDLDKVIERYAIPVDYLTALLDGLESDLERRELQDFPELRLYCYRVASTVGLAMAHVMGATSPAALAAAEEIGIAMQLTNILRDVGRDLASGHVYLPKSELARFDLSTEDLLRLYRNGRGPDGRFRALMHYQIERAHAHYQHGTPGIWLLPPDCRLPILLATRLYRRILAVIEANDYDTLRARAVTSRWTKGREAAIAFAIDRLWSRGERPAPARGLILPAPSPVETADAMVQR